MDPLDVAPAGAGSAALLHALQRAHHRSHGVLLLELEQGGAAAAEIRELREQRAAAAQQSGGSLQVPQHEAPAAAAALHQLGRRLTKAHMLRLGEHPWRLHPHLDNPQDWLHPTRGSAARVHSRILVSTSPSLAEHVDRGLFNLVVGTAADLGPFCLHINGEEVAVAGLLPGDAGPDELFGLVIPGYTLQCLDPATQAVPHSVRSVGQAGAGGTQRSSIVLQWRVNPAFVINGTAVGDIVSQFESVRVQPSVQPAQAPLAQQAQQADDAVPPTLPPLGGFVIVVRTLTGHQYHITAHPEWLVEHLKWAIQQATGQPAWVQKIIYGGRQLTDGRTLQECGLQPGVEVHVVGRLMGD